MKAAPAQGCSRMLGGRRQAWKGWGGACAEGKQVTGEDISGHKREGRMQTERGSPASANQEEQNRPLAAQIPHPGAPDRNHLKFED